MRKIIRQILLITSFFLFAPAQARTTELFGLAMHGAPQYGPGFDHFDYVNPDAPKGGALRMTADGTFDNLNPYAIKGKAAQGLNLYYDRLMARSWGEPFTLYPLIAEKIDVPEDRSGLTVFINPKARFQDGAPITADDVLFSFETLRDHGRPNMRRIYSLVKEAEKTGDLTVRFAFGEGYNAETVMILAMMPVLSKQWWQGREFDSTLLEPPLSSGPYKIAEVDPGRKIVYQRDPGYWAADLPVNRGQYNFDQVIYDYYRNDLSAFEAFKGGDSDLRTERDAGKWVSDYDFPAVKKGETILEALPHNRPEQVRGLIFNTRRAPFDDRRVREALILALDFKWINDALFHGQYKRIASYFANSELAATGEPSADELALLAPWRDQLQPEVFGPAWQPPTAQSQQEFRQNLRKADTLLKEAGWIVQNGKRINPDAGKPFTFDILLDSPDYEKIVLTYADALKKLGIEVTVRVLDAAAYRGRLTDYDFDMTLNYWQNSLSPGTEQMLYWSCESARLPSRWNYPGICDPAVDALAAGIANARTREDLVAHARALDRILTWGGYIIPLSYAGADFVAYRNGLRHPEQMSLYGTILESWWKDPDPEQK